MWVEKMVLENCGLQRVLTLLLWLRLHESGRISKRSKIFPKFQFLCVIVNFVLYVYLNLQFYTLSSKPYICYLTSNEISKYRSRKLNILI